MPKTESPLALEALDKQLGTQTLNAYEHASDLAPHLGGLAVVLDNERSSFHPSDLGLPGSYVTMNPDRTYYSAAIRSGKVKARMETFSTFFGERGIIPSINELVESVLLHELGHAHDLHTYVQKTGGDTLAAFKLSRDVRKSQLATLPLKSATSRAEKAWNINNKGYRDKMRAQGITDQKWAELLKRNTEAYAQLPCETVADRFALGVLATIYS